MYIYIYIYYKYIHTQHMYIFLVAPPPRKCPVPPHFVLVLFGNRRKLCRNVTRRMLMVVVTMFFIIPFPNIKSHWINGTGIFRYCWYVYLPTRIVVGFPVPFVPHYHYLIHNHQAGRSPKNVNQSLVPRCPMGPMLNH